MSHCDRDIEARTCPDRSREKSPLPIWMWLGLPALSLLILWIVPLFGGQIWWRIIHGEIGFLEIGTVVFLVLTVLVSVLVFRRREQLPRGIGWIVLLVGLGAFYFAGEEISWGQTYFQWETPEAFRSMNRQVETNLHNLSWQVGFEWMNDLLNNVPRQGLLLFCIAGAISPWIWRKKRPWNSDRTRRGYWLMPVPQLAWLCLIAIFSTVPEKLYKVFIKHNPNVPNWNWDDYAYMAFVSSAGEFKEYCYALVMLFYVLSIYLRIASEGEEAGLAAEPHSALLQN